MNYHITILYCYVFHLASFGLDAEIVHFELLAIRGPRTHYKSGLLTYFPKSDEMGDLNHYIYLETFVPSVDVINIATQSMEGYVAENSLDEMRARLIDITDYTTGQIYKIMQKDIEQYIYDNNYDVCIVYKGNCYILKFLNIEDPKKFIETLPSSVTLMDRTNYESIKSLVENFNS